MSAAEVPPGQTLDLLPSTTANVIDENTFAYRRLCREVNSFLFCYSMTDSRFEAAAAALCARGIEVSEFVDGQNYGISIHFSENLPGPHAQIGVYPNEHDEFDWLGAEYTDAQGNRQVFEIREGVVIAPPAEILDAFRLVNESLVELLGQRFSALD